MSRTLDPEEVHSLLEQFLSRVDGIVQSHGGHVDKHIGDCVMAVFGAPVSHDDDATRAIHAAIAILEAMLDLTRLCGRELLVHIGISSGHVIAGGTGSARRKDYTVTGESVNLASRLSDMAGTGGEILVSDVLFRELAEIRVRTSRRTHRQGHR